MSKLIFILATLLAITSLVFGGCTAPTTTVTVTKTEATTITTTAAQTTTTKPPTTTATPTQTAISTTPPTPVIIPPMPTVQYGSEYPIIQLTNALGINAVIEVKSVDTDDDLLNYVMWNGYSNKQKRFLLHMSNGRYMFIPWELFRRAYESQGQHVVTLADGTDLVGELDCLVAGTDGKKYDLRTATTVILTSLPEDDSSNTQAQATLWKLNVTQPENCTYFVINPRFSFQYYSRAGYLIGGDTYQTRSESFYIDIGGSEILVNLTDLERFIFDPTTNNITIKATGGSDTTGTLVLKHEDSKGYHEGYDNWLLVADYNDNSGISIALDKSAFILLEISH